MDLQCEEFLVFEQPSYFVVGAVVATASDTSFSAHSLPAVVVVVVPVAVENTFGFVAFAAAEV